MAEYERRLRKVLRKYGCYFVRQGRGEHEIWYSPVNNHTFAVDGKIKSRHSANEILKEAGLDYKFD